LKKEEGRKKKEEGRGLYVDSNPNSKLATCRGGGIKPIAPG
jgi:hypothetical protein